MKIEKNNLASKQEKSQIIAVGTGCVSIHRATPPARPKFIGALRGMTKETGLSMELIRERDGEHRAE